MQHAHLLLTLDPASKISSGEVIDNAIRAELPMKRAIELRHTVLSCLIHTPCGTVNPHAQCMKDGRCSKHFPKEYCNETVWHEGDLHPSYRRRRPSEELSWLHEPYTSRGATHLIDSRNVVPYNPYLTSKYDSHINVKCCNSVKYLFKYVYKGHDKGQARTATTGADGAQAVHDEISHYEDCRVIGASEACWRLFAFSMSVCLPPVLAIPVHLENGQRVMFEEQHVHAVALAPPPRTPLTEWFKLIATLKQNEPRYLYHEMVQAYTWDKARKVWKKRARQRFVSFPQIARMHTVHPTAREVFHLRLLLHNEHSRGKKSFADLKVLPDGVTVATYKDMCRHLGLLQDDGEWHAAMDDAAVTCMCSQIRSMYVMIIEFCNPADPVALFDQH